MLQVGEFRDRIQFSLRGEATDDGYGNTEQGWDDQFVEYAKLLPMRGGENIVAARLEGRQPFIVTVRRSAQTERITTDWRGVNVDRPAQVFNVRSASWLQDTIDLLCETGVAV